MKGKLIRLLKVLLFVLCFVIIFATCLFLIYHQSKTEKIEENINHVYHIYNNDNRQDIINEYSTINNDDNIENTVGVPVVSEQNKEETLNAIATLEIPSINFKDIVIEGTTQDALAQGIGLFEHSRILEGNVCLAGHNSTRFFANLNQVQQGDIIKYSSCLGNKEYQISTIKEIAETDWSMLEETEDNRLTIITCVKDQPSIRLCVQANEVQ